MTKRGLLFTAIALAAAASFFMTVDAVPAPPGSSTNLLGSSGNGGSLILEDDYSTSSPKQQRKSGFRRSATTESTASTLGRNVNFGVRLTKHPVYSEVKRLFHYMSIIHKAISKLLYTPHTPKEGDYSRRQVMQEIDRLFQEYSEAKGNVQNMLEMNTPTDVKLAASGALLTLSGIELELHVNYAIVKRMKFVGQSVYVVKNTANDVFIQPAITGVQKIQTGVHNGIDQVQTGVQSGIDQVQQFGANVKSNVVSKTQEGILGAQMIGNSIQQGIVTGTQRVVEGARGIVLAAPLPLQQAITFVSSLWRTSVQYLQTQKMNVQSAIDGFLERHPLTVDQEIAGVYLHFNIGKRVDERVQSEEILL